MNKNLIIFLIFTITSFHALKAQSYNPQQIKIASRIESLSDNAISEIAYIQTSKDIYELGEDLWFKVYLLDSHLLIPSLLSKTLYLQLINESTKKAVWEEKYGILNGTSSGRVFLSATLPEGDYLLVAYTPFSFFNDTAEIKAIKRIKLKEDIVAHPSLRVELTRHFTISQIQFL